MQACPAPAAEALVVEVVLADGEGEVVRAGLRAQLRQVGVAGGVDPFPARNPLITTTILPQFYEKLASRASCCAWGT